MSGAQADSTHAGTGILVRYWASLRAAAGRHEDLIEASEVVTLAELKARVVALHPGTEQLISVCSVLVGDDPVKSQDPAEVPLGPGDVVELLPPFAGG